MKVKGIRDTLYAADGHLYAYGQTTGPMGAKYMGYALHSFDCPCRALQGPCPCGRPIANLQAGLERCEVYA